ncbi:hypothetical protein F7725_001608 [Dissostichus mawsoni]|uniref:CxC3 like cysteine cluster domain-containing protein n=1 Tax=Dissostichus mawsoni TaxID=36200 RepID=A0A7J5Y1T4_DISMA|nr:hypothetical protein F7725_001608 [Dissostichus mawsoni]
MSDSEHQDPLKSLDDFLDNEELKNEMESLDDLIRELQDEEVAAPVQTPEPTIRWTKRDIDGNIIYSRPRSSRNQSNEECFLRDLQHSLSDTSENRKHQPELLLSWLPWIGELEKVSFHTVEDREAPSGEQHSATRKCGKPHLPTVWEQPSCCSLPDCRPSPFFCAECDVGMHTRHVLHNRDAMIAVFFQPLPPSTVVVDKALSRCVRLVPVEMPAEICSCSPVSLRVNPGKAVAVVTVNGRHDLSMPELSCDACHATWAAGVDNLIRSGYWPATLQFATIYDTDVFHSFEEMKMAAPGLSCQAF